MINDIGTSQFDISTLDIYDLGFRCNWLLLLCTFCFLIIFHKLSWQVNNEPSVGENAFVWLGSLVPLVADVANGRFTYESLTATTGLRLHFPAYDMFLKEMAK